MCTYMAPVCARLHLRIEVLKNLKGLMMPGVVLSMLLLEDSMELKAEEAPALWDFAARLCG